MKKKGKKRPVTKTAPAGTTLCRLRFVLDYDHRCMPHYDSLDNLQRARLIEWAGQNLRAKRMGDFHDLMASHEWNPFIRIDPDNKHPLQQQVHIAVSNALKCYNDLEFPQRFDTDAERLAARFARSSGDPDLPITCVTITWDEEGEAVVEYNYTTSPVEGSTLLAMVSADNSYNVFDEMTDEEIAGIDPDRKLVAVWQVHVRFALALPLEHIRDARADRVGRADLHRPRRRDGLERGAE